jgi:heme exporter protein CcmD
MTHAGYVLAAYGFAFVVLALVLAHSIHAYRRAVRK